MSFPLPGKLNKDLYGPNRISAKSDIKNILLHDHVLQEGEWNPENVSRKPWTTSFSIDFQAPPSSRKVKKHEKSSLQTNVTNFVLGSEEGPYLATTSKDFDKKLHGAPIKAAPDQATSIADFAPRFMVNKSFGKSGSVYVGSFSKAGQPHASSAKNRAECRWHTKDLNATHFQFGTNPDRYGTENTHSFKTATDRTRGEGPTNVSKQAALETLKSRVFRSGDWNVAQPGSVRHSVTRDDFHIKPFASEASTSSQPEQQEEEDCTENLTQAPVVRPEDDPHHPHYQKSTHFVLGSNTEDRSSLYYKDFMLGKRDCLPKPLPAPPPISSKVLPNLQDCLPLCSTNTADFVDHKNRIKGIGLERDAEVKVNRERHNTQAVVLTCDTRRHTGDRQASMTGYDYLHPPKGHECLSPRQAPRSKYRYLDSDGALLRAPQWPSSSETKEEFVPIEDLMNGDVKTKLKDKKSECVGRIQDNRSTHFQFGSDGEPMRTEQHHEFSKTVRFDPSLPAAGKSEGPEQKYSHVYPSESAEQDRQSKPRPPGPRDKVAMIQDQIQELSQQRYFNPRDPMNINLRKAFLEFDTSLSGKISKENLRKVLNNLGVEMDAETFEKLFEICDVNHSGFIDYQEFAKHLTKDLPLSRGTKPSGLSVMRADYAPPEQRKFTSAQLRTIEMSKRIAPISVTSHYFHKHRTGAPRFSTTAQDFVRPDRLPGSPRLSAR